MSLGQPGHPVQQHTVGTKKPAVGTGHNRSQQEYGHTENDHVKIRSKAEKTDKWVVLTDNKPCAGGSEQDGQAQIHVGKNTQDAGQPSGYICGLKNHSILNRSKRTDGGTESAAKEQGQNKGKNKKYDDEYRNGVGRVEQRQADVLDSADRTHASLSVKSEIGERKHHQEEDIPPRSLLVGEIGGQRESYNEDSDIDVFQRSGPGCWGDQIGPGIFCLKIGFGEAFRDLGQTQQREEKKQGHDESL